MKKSLTLVLIMMLSISLVGCDKKEEVGSEIPDEEKVVLTDELGNEFVYSKKITEDIQTGFDILNEYTYEELKLRVDKENYLWGPEDNYRGIYIGDESTRCVVIHAGRETLQGTESLMTYYIDTENRNVYIWDIDKGEYVLLTKEN